jgi:hypothetical protein
MYTQNSLMLPQRGEGAARLASSSDVRSGDQTGEYARSDHPHGRQVNRRHGVSWSCLPYELVSHDLLACSINADAEETISASPDRAVWALTLSADDA